MKIYEVRECGGEWEDSYDVRLKAFLSREKAEAFRAEKLEWLKGEQTQIQLCRKCPVAYGCYKSEEEIKKVLKENEWYAECIKDAPIESDDGSAWIGCWHSGYDAVGYHIEEVEVEE